MVTYYKVIAGDIFDEHQFNFCEPKFIFFYYYYFIIIIFIFRICWSDFLAMV